MTKIESIRSTAWQVKQEIAQQTLRSAYQRELEDTHIDYTELVSDKLTVLISSKKRKDGKGALCLERNCSCTR